jgi:hypothetical protein
MSAIHPKADIRDRDPHVRFGPEADIWLLVWLLVHRFQFGVKGQRSALGKRASKEPTSFSILHYFVS